MHRSIIYLLCLSLTVAATAAEPVARHAVEDDVCHRLDAIEARLRGLDRLPPVGGVVAAGYTEAGACPACDQRTGACSCETGKPAADKFPTFKVTGFFQLDAGFYSQDAVNRATLLDIEDGLGFRRARLAAAGNVTERTSYIMEFDFAQAQSRIVDVWMQFDETPVGNLRIGRFRQPFRSHPARFFTCGCG